VKDRSLEAGESSELRGDLGVALAFYERALADTDPQVVAEAHFRVGRIAWRQGRFDTALAEYTTAAAMAVPLALPSLRARIENGIGAVHYARGAYAQARASYAVAQELAGDDATLRGKILLNLGVISNIEGDLAGARDAYRRSRDAFASVGDESGETLVLHNLGMVYADMQHWDEAAECYTRCLQLSERLGNRQMVANVLLNESELECQAGRYEVAVAQCERALAIYVEIGDEPGRADALRGRAQALRRLRRFAEAATSLQDAARIATRLQTRLLEGEVQREWGLLAAATGDVADARRRLTDALALFKQLGAQREHDEVRAELAALSEG
jgi:tetratricopeptide (TPR) repeat protein